MHLKLSGLIIISTLVGCQSPEKTDSEEPIKVVRMDASPADKRAHVSFHIPQYQTSRFSYIDGYDRVIEHLTTHSIRSFQSKQCDLTDQRQGLMLSFNHFQKVEDHRYISGVSLLGGEDQLMATVDLLAAEKNSLQLFIDRDVFLNAPNNEGILSIELGQIYISNEQVIKNAPFLDQYLISQQSLRGVQAQETTSDP